MSILLIVGYLVIAYWLISQFGGFLSARSTVVWWGLLLFLLIAVVNPSLLLPVAHVLGIELVSNFVLATMLVLLMVQSIQESGLQTRLHRKMRQIVSMQAAQNVTFQNRQAQALVAIPCYNEEEHLPQLIESILSFKKTNPAQDQFEFCVINDGSLDLSRSILESCPTIPSVHHLTNVGVAGVMLTAFTLFKSETQRGSPLRFVIQMDADGQHPIEELPRLLEEAKRTQSDLMIGSRFLSSVASSESTSSIRVLGSILIRLTLRLFSSKIRVTDPTSGFRAYSSEAVHSLIHAMPDDYPEPESIAILLMARKKISETEVKMKPRQGGVSSLAGISGPKFMFKVMSSLLGLRLRKQRTRSG